MFANVRKLAYINIKEPITPNLCTCLKRIALFCPFLTQILIFLQAVKVTKSGYHLSHDRASKGWVYSLLDVTNFFACMFTKT